VVGASRSPSLFPLGGLAVAAGEDGVAAAVGEGGAAVVVLADSEVGADSVAAVVGRAGDENSEP
jgi:hypothetical protein